MVSDVSIQAGRQVARKADRQENMNRLTDKVSYAGEYTYKW